MFVFFNLALYPFSLTHNGKNHQPDWTGLRLSQPITIFKEKLLLCQWMFSVIQIKENFWLKKIQLDVLYFVSPRSHVLLLLKPCVMVSEHTFLEAVTQSVVSGASLNRWQRPVCLHWHLFHSSIFNMFNRDEPKHNLSLQLSNSLAADRGKHLLDALNKYKSK